MNICMRNFVSFNGKLTHIYFEMGTRLFQKLDGYSDFVVFY